MSGYKELSGSGLRLRTSPDNNTNSNTHHSALLKFPLMKIILKNYCVLSIKSFTDRLTVLIFLASRK